MKAEEYVSKDGEYIIPVAWEMYSTVKVTGVKNLKEALAVVEKYLDDIPLDNGEYIDGSYRITNNEDDEAIIDAQSYTHFGVDFPNPDAED